MTYADALHFLYELRWYGAKLGLETTCKLAALAGNPQDHLRFIHVAGTNGKGSTCAMLESIYRAGGLKVGLFTSPHLVSLGERIEVNRRPIPERDLVRLAAEMKSLLRRGWTDPAAEEHPTFFEVVTVMALRYFAEQKCELVLWETGLGGRLDATNIVTPLASVITNIQYDHEKWLGETLASIAAEKAGIIKPGVPVITGANAPQALEVITARAEQQKAPLTLVKPEDVPQFLPAGLHLSLPGQHQKMNAAVAAATVHVLKARFPVTDMTLQAGLERVEWPGRLQLVTRPTGQKVLLDGAHNIAGAETLASALRDSFAVSGGAEGVKRGPALILGILRDKNWTGMCEILAPLAGRVLLVPVHSERTAEPHGLAEVCHRANPAAQVTECAALQEAFAATAQEPFLVVAGSLYLIGEAMELLGLSTANSERGLNEYELARRPKS